MKYNLINTDNYLLVVDDSEIKEGDWFFRDGSIHKCFRVHRTDIEFLTSIDSIYCGSNTFWSKEYCKKIMAHAPLNNSPILEGVPLLPPLEDDVEKLDEEHSPYPKPYKTYEKGFDKGYNKACEKYKFTEEDIRQAYLFGKSMMSPKNFEKYLQSLQQPKYPIAFECEVQHYYYSSREFYHDASFVKCTKEQYNSIKTEIPTCPLKEEIKTIINSEGRTEWVGKYIYE